MKVNLEFCLGSSCFARGNKSALEETEQYLKQNDLSGSISITGRLCMKNCSDGPVVKVNDQLYFGKNGQDLIEIIKKKIQ